MAPAADADKPILVLVASHSSHTGIRRQCLPAPIGCLASAWCRALEKARAENYFGGSSSLLFNQPFGFGVGFCGFLSGFFCSELKNMSCSLPL
jgi:hypothetical protein